MRVVVQRVSHAKVTVDDEIVGQINKGYLLLVGITHDDTIETVRKVVDKIVHLRIFNDENDKMNCSILDVDGEILSISQFTLYADCKKGRRPSFSEAAKVAQASQLYDDFNQCLVQHKIHVEKGIFQADMKVELVNDGPVTIMLDSQQL